MKKKKAKKFRIRRIIAIIIIFVIIILVKNLIAVLSMKNQSDKIRLLLDNEFINLTNKIYREDEVLYISEEDIKNIFDNNIYFNVGDKELITTYNKHVAVMYLNENKMSINDSETQIQGMLKEIDSKIYLPITDLGIVYDVEMEFSEQTNILIMDSTTKYKAQAIALDNTKVKLKKTLFSPTVEKVNRGESLYVIEQNGGYKKVKTIFGNIGYIKSKKVSEEEILREDWTEENLEISNLEEATDILFVTQAQLNITSVANTFTTYTQRNQMIKQLYNQVIENQYTGICIDFDKIDDINSFYRFLIELTPKFKESGLKVMVKINQYIDKKKVKDIVDYTF